MDPNLRRLSRRPYKPSMHTLPGTIPHAANLLRLLSASHHRAGFSDPDASSTRQGPGAARRIAGASQARDGSIPRAARIAPIRSDMAPFRRLARSGWADGHRASRQPNAIALTAAGWVPAKRQDRGQGGAPRPAATITGAAGKPVPVCLLNSQGRCRAGWPWHSDMAPLSPGSGGPHRAWQSQAELCPASRGCWRGSFTTRRSRMTGAHPATGRMIPH